MTSPQLILGFDLGTHRIGVACGNTLTRSAQPLKVLTSRHEIPWDDIAALVAEYSPSQFVVGLPYNMDGTDTTLSAAAREFAAQLESRFKRSATLVDERLSSRAAEADLRDARREGRMKKRVTHGDVDRMAAKVLVEQWLRET